MVTTNQKPIIDTQKTKRKEYKHNTIGSHQLQVKRAKEGIENNYRNNQKQQNGSKYTPVSDYLFMREHMHIYLFIFEERASPRKGQRWGERHS